ncbi:MAG: ABC-F family ATP-binding cassette domain-containing protein [Acidobacteria bacterium]|nr:ABC-F family ATP-binding cassette domain-containing protein [Acidobacteriota bacterium]
MLFRFGDITKSYGGTEILRGVSFQINPGEKVGLVGRNGAGKTTVFRLLTGAESPDTGEIAKINGLRLGLLDQHVDFAAGETVHTAALSAFKEIHDIEAEMRRLEKQMETDHSAETLDRYADLQIRFEQADGFTYAARAEAILLGLGFAREQWSLDTGILSGGQKNRLGMARLLLSGADVLLLDEPTNHLDVNAVEWLESFLSEYDKAYVVISHDRYFLDRTTDRIIEIENGRAVSYKGNYSKFLVERELRREQQQREYENQQALINKTQEFIRRNIEGQKTKQAKSRRNMLERMERVEAVIADRSGGSFGLKKVERTGNNVLMAEDLSIGYGDKILASGINLSLHRGEALGIIGANGTGKTTFLKTILGQIRELDGKFIWGTKADIGYYAQNLDDLHPANEIVQELRRVDPLADNGTLRSFLARFLFFGEDVFKRVGDLSGGEKGRLALAKLIYSRKNVLVLDEPTNHLDIPSREALEDALREYDGTIITVSHDRFFLDKIATQILAFELDGVDCFSGNYTEYHDWKVGKRPATAVAANVGAAVSSPADLAADAAPPANGSASSPAAKAAESRFSKNQLRQMKERVARLEELIAEAEDRLARYSAEMSEPAAAANAERIAELARLITETESEIEHHTLEWEKLSIDLET